MRANDTSTVDEVAREFGRARSTVRNWCRRGVLVGAFGLHGREWRIPTDAVTGLLVGAKQFGRRGSMPGASPGLVDWRTARL